MAERDWVLRPASAEDAPWLADLKATTMRPDLERLGYWDREWARQRFLDAFVPQNTQVIVRQGRDVGCIALRAETDAWWLEHFYLDPAVQGGGVGGAVLAHVLATCSGELPVRLALDRGSAAQRLYERHGFVYRYDDDNGVDQIFERR